jgi:predicted dehydrogenase
MMVCDWLHLHFREETMATENKVNIGIVGTGFWAEVFHLPALATCEQANVIAVCGHNPEKTQEFATKWNIPHIYTDYMEMFKSGLIEAIFILTPNDTHYPIAMEALKLGIHVLCEKPLALNYAQAAQMATLAQEKRLITSVAFTYRHMPVIRYLKQLLDEGYIGKPYFLHLRYFATFAREPGTYMWRYDREVAGSGVVGDLGSHCLDLAEWFYGEIEAVCAQLGSMVKRAELTPQGQPYEQADDSAMIMIRFKNGAQGVLHATSIAYEKTFQRHEFDFHGSDGTLRELIDWDTKQELRGGRSQPGEDTMQALQVPDSFWGKVGRETVLGTLLDIVQKEGRIIHEFVAAVTTQTQILPDFATGARVQQLLDAALLSAKTGCWVQTS